jgi:hypothetical protein
MYTPTAFPIYCSHEAAYQILGDAQNRQMQRMNWARLDDYYKLRGSNIYCAKLIFVSISYNNYAPISSSCILASPSSPSTTE